MAERMNIYQKLAKIRKQVEVVQKNIQDEFIQAFLCNVMAEFVLSVKNVRESKEKYNHEMYYKMENQPVG